MNTISILQPTSTGSPANYRLVLASAGATPNASITSSMWALHLSCHPVSPGLRRHQRQDYSAFHPEVDRCPCTGHSLRRPVDACGPALDLCNANRLHVWRLRSERPLPPSVLDRGRAAVVGTAYSAKNSVRCDVVLAVPGPATDTCHGGGLCLRGTLAAGRERRASYG